MKLCTTHHRACDCREAEHRAALDALRAENKRLRRFLRGIYVTAGHTPGSIAGALAPDAIRAACRDALARRKR